MTNKGVARKGWQIGRRPKRVPNKGVATKSVANRGVANKRVADDGVAKNGWPMVA